MPRLWILYLEWMQRQLAQCYRHSSLVQSGTRSTARDATRQNLDLLSHVVDARTTPMSTTTTITMNRPTRLVLEIPAETIVRVMRRHAHFFDPSAKERLAQVCIELEDMGKHPCLCWNCSMMPMQSRNSPNMTCGCTWPICVHVMPPKQNESVLTLNDWCDRPCLLPKRLQGWNVITEQEE